MNIVKVIALILLAVFLIFNSLVSLMGYHLHWFPAFILGLIAVASGVLMLLSIKEFWHYPMEE
jgi:hypothetical protein